MSDELSAKQTPPADAPAMEGKKTGFLATSTGKIVAIVVGLGILGIVAGIAVAIVLYVFGSQAVDDLENQIKQPSTETTGTDAGITSNKPTTAAAEVPNSEVFTFRDIFVPLLKPLASTTSTTGTTGTTTTTDTVTPTSNGTLYLDGVVTQDGVLMAQLRFNGKSYTLPAGGVIPSSPWQVLRVSSTSVTMLFGDTQVTLSVGQGITK